MMEYYLAIDNGHDYSGNAGPYSSLDEAKRAAIDVLCSLMEWTISDWSTYGWYASETEAWNEMIYNAWVTVEAFDPFEDDYVTVWEPDDDTLCSIGWIEREEM